MIKESRTYYIDSAQRSSGSNENFSFLIPFPSDVEEYDRVTLVSALIPKSYYTIPQNFNTFTLNEGGNQTTVTIPIGCMGRSLFQSILTTALNAASFHGWTYSISWPTSGQAQTGLFTYSVTGNGGVQPQFILSPSSPYECLGFTKSSTNTFVANSLTSINVIKMQGEDSLFIHSSLVANESTDIFKPIYVSGWADYSNISYVCPDIIGNSKCLRKNRDNFHTFSLSDENGNQMNLNGLNWLIEVLIFKSAAPLVKEPSRPGHELLMEPTTLSENVMGSPEIKELQSQPIPTNIKDPIPVEIEDGNRAIIKLDPIGMRFEDDPVEKETLEELHQMPNTLEQKDNPPEENIEKNSSSILQDINPKE